MKQLSSSSCPTQHQYIASGFIEEEDQEPTNVSQKRKRSSSASLKFSSPKEEVQTSINQLLDRVPKVDELFTISKKIGEGTFSSVYLATLKKFSNLNSQFALKHITPTSHPDRVSFELYCLQTIGGVDNVMATKLCLRNRDHVVMVMPYFKHERFQDYVREVGVDEVRDYMLNLLLALRRVHSFNIIHRDVKPSNFLYNRKLKKFALVDFGLAHIIPSSAVMKEIQEESRTGCSTSLSLALASKSSGSSHLSPSKRRARRIMSYSENQMRRNIQRRQSVPVPNNARLSERNLNTLNQRIASSRHDELQRRRELSQQLFKSPKKSSHRNSSVTTKPTVTRSKEDVRYQSRRISTSTNRGQCSCFGTQNTCNICMSRTVEVAARAGTPGFRPPEVLMKCQKQTTAVDIWSAGVIFLSLLSGRYPFFRASDDMTSLAQIISIMGTDKMKEAASSYGKTLVCSPTLPALNLKTLCEQLRQGNAASKVLSTEKQPDTSNSKRSKLSTKRISPSTRKTSPRLRSHVTNEENSHYVFPDSAYNLLYRLLDLNPATRITAEAALAHPFLAHSSFQK
ncbi:cell division cycle 7-related protein kinase-like [Anneissia japonica]|uniref:cell division cycle 7-related protein kinase-like n=1 Tax=Anneissia japonica TaxID=1529436 RepID=UPI001425AC5F|nr:cell division cycle 7-related protein kinase-like [Anneissia japonica]